MGRDTYRVLPQRPLDRSENTRAWWMPRAYRAPRGGDHDAPRSRQVVVTIKGHSPPGAAPSHKNVMRRLHYYMQDRDRDYPALDEKWRDLDYAEGRQRLRDWTIASRATDGPQVLYVTLSPPEGTPGEIVMDAGREAAARMWAGHRFILVFHDDSASGVRHLHALVHRTPIDMQQPMLRHSPEQLIQWRETLAEELVARGVEARATFGLELMQEKEEQAQREQHAPRLTA